MSHALLLRLFQSPNFFSVHVALQYLRTYGDHVGITHYLAGRLKGMDPSEIEGLWGLVCHLLVTRPSKSTALEYFVLERAEESTHVALLTLWFMQASLHDLAKAKRETPSFAICQRVLNRLHGIIFDYPIRGSTPMSPSSQARRKGKVKPHLGPALAGMGTVIAGVAMPELLEVGEWAVKQGRAEDGPANSGRVRSLAPEEPDAPRAIYEQADDLPEEDEPDSAVEPEVDEQEAPMSPLAVGFRGPLSAPARNFSTASLVTPAKPTRRPSGPHATSPSLPFSILHRPHIDDPLGQLDSPSGAPLPLPVINQHHSRFSSSPSIPSASYRPSTDIQLLARYPSESQSSLLKTNYFRCETRFLLALEAICTRLLIIPKPARVSALRAELTSLNHQLPSEVCLPMWCPSTDAANCRSHHRVVRIPAGECVVLNSAERAPYLLLLEILQGDLDFEPSKRSNKEIVKKMLREQEQEHQVHRKEPEPQSTKEAVGSLGSLEQTALGQTLAEPAEASSAALLPPPVLATIPPTPNASARPSMTEEEAEEEEEEEMDLVEQLYGSDLHVEAVDLADSIVLPAPPKNKALDIATWSRSQPASPRVDGGVNGTPPRRDSYMDVHGRLSPSPPPLPLTPPIEGSPGGHTPPLSLEDYSERMRTAAIMLAQLNASLVREPVTAIGPASPDAPSMIGGMLSWMPGRSPANPNGTTGPVDGGSPSQHPQTMRQKLQVSEAAAIRERIMKEMMSLEEERMQRMSEAEGGDVGLGPTGGSRKTAEDETIVRRELNKSDPSAAVFKESWSVKKARIRDNSPYGHLATWDCISLIVKTGADLRQEQLATQLIREFERIWKEENCHCWARSFRILITGTSSGLVETVTDAVSIHSIKKAEYAKRLAEGRFGHVSLMDHFVTTYGDPGTARFVRAQRNFARSLAGYSVITFLLQIKDRHNGNILLDREGHLIHIDFGFMLSNSPGGNMGFEAAPFKLPLEYVELLGGLESKYSKEFATLFREGFEMARKHAERILTIVELMQKESSLPCFALLGEQTANALRERFQLGLTSSHVGDYVEKLIMSSLGSTWTRLYDSYQYYSQSIL